MERGIRKRGERRSQYREVGGASREKGEVSIGGGRSQEGER